MPKIEPYPGRVPLREVFWFVLPALVIAFGAGWYVLRYAEPAPPSRIAIATGGEGGGYYTFGKRYQQSLARSGVTLDVRTTAGSIENLKLLQDAKSGVSAALMQGGVASGTDTSELQSVGRIFYEPLWIFYKGAEPLDRLAQLAGKRIAVGAEGSGTRYLANVLLTANGVGADTASLLPVSGQAAVDALLSDNADAVFLTFAAEAPIVQAMLKNPAVRLMSLSQAEAYARIYPYLARLVLPQGVIDFNKNIPANDVNLLAPTAALVVRADLHPALVNLLAQTVLDVHSRPGLFQKAGEFPIQADPEFAFSEEARRVYRNGPPFLQRYMPFWLANLLQRLIILLVPIATIAYPIVKLAPVLYNWRIKRRIFYWYDRLRRIEYNLGHELSGDQVVAQQGELAEIERAVSRTPVPLRFSDQLYDLRNAINIVRQRLAL